VVVGGVHETEWIKSDSENFGMNERRLGKGTLSRPSQTPPRIAILSRASCFLCSVHCSGRLLSDAVERRCADSKATGRPRQCVRPPLERRVGVQC